MHERRYKVEVVNGKAISRRGVEWKRARTMHEMCMTQGRVERRGGEGEGEGGRGEGVEGGGGAGEPVLGK